MVSAVRRMVSVNAWFKNPAFGMTQHEILARASGTVVMPVGGMRDRDAWILTSLHVVHPFRYPQYYPPSAEGTAWVHKITPDMIQCTAQVYDMGGELLEQVDCENGLSATKVHPTRDMIALRFRDAKAGSEMLEKFDVPVFEVAPDAQNVLPHSNVSFLGHKIIPRLVDDQDQSLEVPKQVDGVVIGTGITTQLGQDGEKVNLPQTWAWTSETLTVGMCGGPMIAESDGALGGIIEAILSAGDQPEGKDAEDRPAAVAPVSEIGAFLAEITK
mmetsp:Transcript_5837/g.10442  ORF Transcript_5837/g.10442 Transcript_5837/m.10442 type:complete len:272 (-) Transcript_5837:2656-3471(-)